MRDADAHLPADRGRALDHIAGAAEEAAAAAQEARHQQRQRLLQRGEPASRAAGTCRTSSEGRGHGQRSQSVSGADRRGCGL